MRHLKNTLLAAVSLIAVVVFSGMIGCGRVDDYVDCNKICNSYKTCVDSQYDVGECTDYCYKKSREDVDYNRDANECNACLEGRACTESLPCAVQCSTVLP